MNVRTCHICHISYATGAGCPEIPQRSAYPFHVWRSVRSGVACAGTVAVLATSACSGTEPSQPSTDASATAVVETTSPDPTVRVTPSLAPGIPTASPTPRETSSPDTLNASARITIATVDTQTGGLVVGGYVSGVVEDGGDCEYVATASSGSAVSVHTVGVENSSTTSCGSTTVDPSLVPPDSYTVVLRYTNASGQVASDAVEVTIP